MADTITPAEPKKDQSLYINLSRNVITNHVKATRDLPVARALTPTEKLKDFFSKDIWLWIAHTFLHLFGRKHPYPNYTGSQGDTGIFAMHSQDESSDAITIGLTADWATDTQESIDIMNAMMQWDPDYTIHLGDTYYVGNEKETEQNFLTDDAPWVKGPCGSFALMGNHELYSGAYSYFDKLLPSLGIYDPIRQTYVGQKAAYFCLHTPYWLIIGLDTGYNSVGFPFIWNNFIKNCRFEPGVLDWLKNIVDIDTDKRGIIFLTHHQYVSAFDEEDEFPVPAEQLADIIGKERSVLWIWGHEHRFSVYDKYKSEKGITCFGRCIGNGGMPVEIAKMKLRPTADVASRNLVCFDDRIRMTDTDDNGNKWDLGYNGYAILNLNGNGATVTYYDTTKKLIEEKWQCDAATGNVANVSFEITEPAMTVIKKTGNILS